MTGQTIRKLVIAGRDAAAWLAANALMRAFGPSGLSIQVVELPSLLGSADVFMSQPALEAFHRLLGFDEHEVLKACAGTYSLGQSFANFSGPRAPFLHPYGSHGVAIGKVAFHQLWLKARQAGMPVAFEDFSLTAAAAKMGRFFATTAEMAAFARCDYAYHLNAVPYVQYLRAQALQRKVTVTPARLFSANLDAETGNIVSLNLADGTVVEGDLFIDATGADSQLLAGAMGVGFDSWSAWFPANRLLVAEGERMRSLPSYSQVRALDIGCLHVAPTQQNTGLIYAYQDVVKDDDALRDMAVAGLRLKAGATVATLAPGRREVGWTKNCIAIGEAAGVFDPIDSPALHTIQLGLAHLITLFPLDGHCELEAAEYNRNLQRSLERFRDYQITHYKLNQIRDQPMWDRARDMRVPDSLAYKLDLFAARGVVALYDDETFQLDDWLATFIGHGLTPRAYDPLVELMSQEDSIRQVQAALGFIKQQVENMSSHDAYLEMFAARDFA